MNQRRGLGVLPGVEIACKESCRCMQKYWFPQTLLTTSQPSRCVSTVVTPN